MDSKTLNPTTRFADFSRRTLLGTFLTGVIVGVLGTVLGKLLDQFIISPALCRSASEAVCNTSEVTSFHVAGVIAAIVAVVMLVNLSVYRPLLVAIAATIGTWGIYGGILTTLNWPWALALLVVVNVLAYLAFSWMLRIYNLPIALLLTALVVVAMLSLSYL